MNYDDWMANLVQEPGDLRQRSHHPAADHLATWPHLLGYLAVQAVWPPGHLATRPPGHMATWPPGYLATWLLGRPVPLPGHRATYSLAIWFSSQACDP